MKILYIKLKGYIGIYNGLGLNEIEIDLSQSKHKITVLSGINGCGKTTLLKAMSILPDSSSDFIPGVPASKQLKILDNNTIYDILITSAAAKNGRGISKASLVKNEVELNPNGNIGSYKEIIFQEFDLDSNFIALSRLSSDDRGLADKSPAERKKFMSFIVECLETYNAIYKNLNKKSSIFKSYVSNLHTKIQNIGDENNLSNTISSLEQRKQIINANIDSVKNSIVESQTILTMNDPNGAIQSQYEETEKNMKSLKSLTNSSYNEFHKICRSISIEPSMEEVVKFIQAKNTLIESHENNKKESERTKLSLIEKRESIVSDIDRKQRKINELSKGVNPNLVQTINSLRQKVQAEIEILKNIGVTDPDNTSREELQITFETVQTIISMVLDQFYIDLNDSMIHVILDFSKSDLVKLNKSIEKQSELITQLTDQCKDIQRDSEIVNILSNRPEGCNIDNCYFISSAYNLKNKKYKGLDLEEELQKSSISLAEAVKHQDELVQQFELLTMVSQKREILDRIRSIININKSILQKYEMSRNLVDTFEMRIAQLNSFNEFRDMNEIIDKLNTISIYKKDMVSLKSLEAEFITQSSSETMIKDLTEEVVSLQESLDSVTKELMKVNNDINGFSGIIDSLRSEYLIACKAKEKGDIWISNNTRLEEVKTEFNIILEKSKASIGIFDKISSLNVELQNLQSQVQPLENQISVIRGQLTMLESYKEEHRMYSEKYNMVDTLKKYSSPTGGIQTLFMSIYMNKTLELANEVLYMVFGGEYRILDYVINSNEFRIPFVGNGMVVDDISSGSTSQVCMMGMALSLVLLYQASTRYNITRLDEIDGGLDTRNRLEFVNALYKVIDILNIDQLFIISHSLELELSNVDMIRLKMYDNYETPEGNVLYDFQNSTLK